MTPRFPVSDHCDGQNFFNPGPSPGPRGLRQVLRWRFGGRANRARWPARVNDPAFPPPPAAVPPNHAAITHINHATFLIRLSNAVILTDPIFSERCSPLPWAGPRRVRPPGLPLDALPRPDIVLVSHNHYDHMDLPSLRSLLDRFTPRLVTTLGNASRLAAIGIRAVELDWWQSHAIDGVTVTLTPARHFSARTPFDRNRTLWGGFMIHDQAAGQVFFAGDSAAGPHWGEIAARLGAPGVALLPIAAYEPRWFMAAAHMNPAEAVDAHLALRAHRSVGMHFGTFQLTDEAIDAPHRALDAARAAAGVTQDQFMTLGFGETRVFALAPASALTNAQPPP